MKNKLLMAPGLMLLLLVAMPSFAGDTFLSRTETTFWDSSQSYNGYQLFTSLAGNNPEMGATYLIDMEGNVVHKWLMPENHYILLHAYLLPNGNLLRGISPSYINNGTMPALGGAGMPWAGAKYQEVDWNGNVVWEARHPNHRDVTRAEFQQITGLTDAQMNDYAAMVAANTKYQLALLSKYDHSEHHDFRKIFNKRLGRETIMFVNNKYIPEATMLKLGVNTTKTQSPQYPKGVSADCISEVDIQTKQLVWQWCFEDHLIQNFSVSAQNYSVDIANQSYNGNIEEAFYRRLDVNAANNQGSWGPRADWQHVNSMDYNADRDEVVFNSRQNGEFYVVDHNTTIDEAKGKKGDFLYRFGSPYMYASDDQLGAGKGKAKFPSYLSAEYTQIWGAHNIHWIPKGRPGGGNFLIFDNGVGRVGGGYSAVLEINPLDVAGRYVRELDAGYGGSAYSSGSAGFAQVQSMAGQTTMKVSKQVVWGFSAFPSSFYAPHISGAERLANGNTQVTAGTLGHLFEVTSAGDLVWEYTSPIMAGNYVSTVMGVDANGKPLRGGPTMNTNSVFRAHRYAPDFPGLAGKLLYPQGTLTNPTGFTGFGFGSGGTTGGGGAAGGTGGGAGGGY
jgi:hypothetical protein